MGPSQMRPRPDTKMKIGKSGDRSSHQFGTSSTTISSYKMQGPSRYSFGYVEHYNNVRLNSAIGYITPKDMLAGHQKEIHAERDRKLEAARQQRQIRLQQAA